MGNQPWLYLVLAILAIVAALGAVEITSAFSSATEAEAVSCNQIIAGCHGCAPGSQAIDVSEAKCFHN